MTVEQAVLCLIGLHQPGESFNALNAIGTSALSPPKPAFSLILSGLQVTVGDNFTWKLAMLYVFFLR